MVKTLQEEAKAAKEKLEDLKLTVSTQEKKI